MVPIALVLLAVTPAQQMDDRLGRGEWEAVLGELRAQQAEAMKGTDRARRVRISGLLARAQVTSNAYHLRDERLADEVTARALQDAEQGSEPSALAEALLARGRLTYFRGFENRQWEAARPLVERARTLFAGAGDARGESEAWFYLGLIEQQQGRLDAGDQRFRKGLALARGVNDPVLESFFHRHLAASAEERGQLDAAEQGFVESARLRLEAKACVLSPFAQLTLAEFYEKSRRTPEKAPAMVAEAATAAARCGSNRAAAEAWLTLARAAGPAAEKRKHATEALYFARRFGDESLVKEVEAFLATLPGGADGGPVLRP